MSVASANTGEPQMVQQTLDLFAEDTQPERLVGDKGCDSDPLDAVLADLGIEMIAPHRSSRRPDRQTQDAGCASVGRNRPACFKGSFT